MHKINLNADLREVLKRLAGKHKAGVAESQGAPFVQENTQVKVLSPAPQIDER